MKSLIFIVLFFISCDQHIPVKACENKYVNRQIKKDIPESNNQPAYKKLRLEFFNAIGMCYLEDGFDGMQVRIEYTSLKKNQILTITQTQKERNAILSTISWENGKALELKELKREDRLLKPLSGWVKAEEYLTHSGIFNMQDQSKLDNYFVSTGGIAINVEFATRDLYRNYSYPDLYGNIDLNAQAKKMDEIVKSIEKEFSFRFGE